MFGIGFPEMIVIFAVALIVVGPDKLPELARSLAKGILEMKQAANQFKENLTKENETVSEMQESLKTAADDLKQLVLDTETPSHLQAAEHKDQQRQDASSAEDMELRPWEKDAIMPPDSEASSSGAPACAQEEHQGKQAPTSSK
ncbi:MAG: twin-arginine translocase subunit TatB [Desulfobulbus propionicus]|nr:MAG: twin-arginine translocase subunit TatB [Desulfobulbus propionicus]